MAQRANTQLRGILYLALDTLPLTWYIMPDYTKDVETHGMYIRIKNGIYACYFIKPLKLLCPCLWKVAVFVVI